MADIVQKAVWESWPVLRSTSSSYIDAPPAFYELLDNGDIKCNICKRYCVIPPGELGYCLARENGEGHLINRIYRSLNTLYHDPLYPGIDGGVLEIGGHYCNFQCRFCMAETWMTDEKELPAIKSFRFPFNGRSIINEKPETGRILVDPQTIIQVCREYNIKIVSLSRSEPTINPEFILDLAYQLLRAGIGTILWTNGYSTPMMTKDYARLMAQVVVSIKCYFDQAGYDNVCGRGIDVNEVLNTIIDLHDNGANYRLLILADGQHGDPREAYRMFGKLKENLTEEEAKKLDIQIAPVVCFSNKRAVVDPITGGLLCDQLNVRPGDIVGAMELEMGLKRMGFHGAHSKYSADYKAIHGDYPSFWHEEAKNGWLAEVEKQPAKDDIKSYVCLQ